MIARRVEYHQDAVADVKNAVAWYETRNPQVALKFIEELHRATRHNPGGPGTLAKRHEQYKAVPAVAIPVCDHLFRTTIYADDMGRCPWKQAARVLDGSTLTESSTRKTAKL